MNSPAACAVVLLAFSSSVRAQTLLYTVSGTPSESFGWCVAKTGDANGDGVQDFAVGGPAANLGTGVVRVYSGADGTLIRALMGAQPGNNLGVAIAHAGDLDGDGRGDLIVGAPEAYPFLPGNTYYGLGHAIVYSGANGSVLLNIPGVYGAYAGSTFGSSVANAGDIDGDGIPDVLVGQPGRKISGCPIIGGCAVYETGAARIFSGATGSQLWVAMGQFGEPFPVSTTGIGDVNGDGVPDVCIAGTGNAQANDFCSFFCPPWPYHPAHVQLRSGTSAATPLVDLMTGPTLAIQAAPLGDVDLDGIPDVVVTAIGAGTWVTAVVSGSGATIRAMFEAAPGGAFPSIAVSGVGDLDGDGVRDYLLGSGDLGSVRAFSGISGALLFTITGAVFDRFGSALGDLGDLNGDGKGDFGIGASIGGYARIYSGATLPSASVSPLGASCGQTPALTMSLTPPILGTTITVSGTHAPAGAGGMLFASTIPVSPLIAGAGPTLSSPCAIYADPATLLVLGPITADGGGNWSVSGLLPNTPIAAGLQRALNAGFWPASGGFFVPNGLAVTIGY
jgi:hypothetical protein